MTIETVSDNELKVEQQWVVQGEMTSSGGTARLLPIVYPNKRLALKYTKRELCRYLEQDDEVLSAEYRGPDAKPQVVVTWEDGSQIRLTAEEA